MDKGLKTLISSYVKKCYIEKNNVFSDIDRDFLKEKLSLVLVSSLKVKDILEIQDADKNIIGSVEITLDRYGNPTKKFKVIGLN